jgi:integrase
MQTAVVARQKEVAPKDSSHALRLSQLLEPYSRDQGHRKGTADGIRRKVKRFTDFAGDRPLWEYDHETIIAYRDHLRTGPAPVKEVTINQYIAALKMVWNAAPDRWKEYRDIQFPRVKLRKIKDDLQDTRWKSFTDDQMKDLWREMQKAWGPNADTRLTPGRRRAFLMAVRVMLWTGLRPVEVFHLTSENIVGQTIQIRYTKTGNRRTLPLCKHLSDLPAFLAAGGFKTELEAAKNELYAGKARGQESPPSALSKSLRKYFAEVREAAGITDPKQVLYSLKDTLVRRLQLIFKQKGIPVTYDTIRDIIGHKTKGALAHYVTLTGDMDEGLELVKEALDAIEYW